MPRRRSIDLKATAYSRVRAKRENFRTRIWKLAGRSAALEESHDRGPEHATL